MTIQEICDSYSLKLIDLAAEVGVSVSLLSKIKNGISPITQHTRDKFYEVYPDIFLEGGRDKWKEKYYEECAKSKALQDKINSLEKRIKDIKGALKTINDKVYYE